MTSFYHRLLPSFLVKSNIAVFLFTIISDEFKYLYLIVTVISILYIVVDILKKRLIVRKAFLYSMFFIMSFLPSVFYGVDLEWAKSQYGSLLIRAVPPLIVTLTVIDLSSLSFYFSRLCIVVTSLYTLWLAGVFDLIGLKTNFENLGASMIISTLPFALMFRKVFIVSIAVCALLLSASRMGGFLAIFLVGLYLLIYFKIMPKPLSVVALPVLFVAASASIILLNLGVFFPSDAPTSLDSDFVRKAQSFYGLYLLKEHPVWGVGMGQFSIYMKHLFGREVIAHGFLNYIWVQCGLVPFILFVILSAISMIKPLLVFSRTGTRSFLALGLANIGGFMFFLTRTQQDSTLYFLMFFLGIACVYRRGSANLGGGGARFPFDLDKQRRPPPGLLGRQ